MNISNVAYHWESHAAVDEPRVVVNDDMLLDEMRDIMKRYVASYQAEILTPISQQGLRKEFEKLRDQLADPLLKEYSSFEFMEKLYLQECSLEFVTQGQHDEKKMEGSSRQARSQ